MPAAQEELRAAGIEIAVGDRSGVRPECTRLARQLRGRRVRAIGLAPADEDVAVPAVALELGRALAATSASPVAVVDAHGSWPCARGLATGAAADGGSLATSWLLDNLAVLTPRVPRPGAALDHLHDALARRSPGFDALVFDLTGLDHLGQHLAAFDLLDAVTIVARCGRTTARQVERRLRDLPAERGLGVLLTGL